MKAKITGTGSYIPKSILTNDDLSKMVDTSDDWIRSRTGIRTRYIAKEESTSYMASRAAEKAIDNAGISISDIDMIIVATSTPDYGFPNCASLVQKEIGAINAACFDISAACSGFITALITAKAFIETGKYKKILVAGSDRMSSIVDWKDRSVCVLFGDGAGAAVIEAEKEYRKSDVSGVSADITDYELHNDGNISEVLSGGYKLPISMNGQEVFKFAVRKVPLSIETLLKKNNCEIKDVDYFILHQANVRIIESVSKRLKTDMAKFPVNLDKYGNTSAASIPVLLDEMNRNNKFKNAKKVVLSGFGAGLSWGSILLTM